jgi:hypothetical protein
MRSYVSAISSRAGLPTRNCSHSYMSQIPILPGRFLAIGLQQRVLPALRKTRL